MDRKGKKWKHEDASEMMFDDLIKQNKVQISKQDADFIKALIAGEPNRTGYVEGSFIFCAHHGLIAFVEMLQRSRSYSRLWRINGME